MVFKNKTYLNLIIWIAVLIGVGSLIGSFTKPEINSWYLTLNRSSLTPPNYVFPIAWTILYGILGYCGWLIWSQKPSHIVDKVKKLFGAQLLLNWSWTPLFFVMHQTGIALGVLVAMDILVVLIIYLPYPKMKQTALLLVPYLLWILFATYLNYYLWVHP